MKTPETSKSEGGLERQLSTVVLGIALSFVGVQFLFRCPRLTFPDNWFFAVSFIGLESIVAAIVRLCIHEAREKEKLRTGPIPSAGATSMSQRQQSEMHFGKNLQWNLTYYFILVFAAILGVERMTAPTDSVRVLLYALAVAAFGISLYYLVQVQFHIRNVRISISRTAEFRQRFNNSREVQEHQRRDSMFFRDVRFALPIFVTAIIAFCVVASILWQSLGQALLRLTEAIIR